MATKKKKTAKTSKAKPRKPAAKVRAKAKAAAKPKKAAKAKSPAKAKKAAAKPKKAVAKAKSAKPKKAVAKAKSAKPSKAKGAPQRRDRAGHIAPAYGRDLLRKSGGPDRDEESRGFLKGSRSQDDLAEQLGEEFIETATTGEDEGNEVLDQAVEEELGGPFVVTTAGQEYAEGTDASNPRGSKREPFPRV